MDLLENEAESAVSDMTQDGKIGDCLLLLFYCFDIVLLYLVSSLSHRAFG